MHRTVLVTFSDYFLLLSMQAAIASLEASLQKSHEQIEKKDQALLATQEQISLVS